ncbi:glycosyltransferase [Candidatus Woesearchaeota archaeon]|nr:glycosyltransferase [Candidatus Woesearchaeota archaeon]
MKNVLVAATTFPRWPNDTEPGFVFELSRLLAKKGYNIIVLAPHYPGAKKFETTGGMQIYRFPYFWPLKYQKLCYEGGILENIKKNMLARVQVPFLLFFELLHIIEIIKREKIDIIHAHWLIPQGFLAAVIKKFCRIHYIATAHAGDIFPLRKRLLKSVGAFSIKNADCMTANSTFTKNSVLGIYGRDIEIIPMGVDLRSFSPKNKDAKIREKYGINGSFILFVGRLAEKKGTEYLIRAIPMVLEKLPNSKLLIVGDGPEKERLENLTNELKLNRNVIFAGKVINQDLPKYYATADIFVGPSIVAKGGDTEGLGIVFLEAIASGTCVVGTNVGGIPDIIKNNETGLLVEEKNLEELAKAIVKLLKDKKLQQKLKKNAMNHIRKNYSWDIVAEKFSSLYAKIL